MNQREQAKALVRNMGILHNRSGTEVLLRDLVGEAQNGPPHGGADGSLDEPSWTALRDLCNALDALEGALSHARECV